MSTPRPYRTLAKRRWGKKAEWICGEGPYAVLAHCRVLTVSLHPTLERAHKAKKRIDETGCGGCCNKQHEIVPLRKTPAIKLSDTHTV